MMRRKSPPSEHIYFIENHCQTNISKGIRGNDFNNFFHERDKIVLCIHLKNVSHYLYLA